MYLNYMILPVDGGWATMPLVRDPVDILRQRLENRRAAVVRLDRASAWMSRLRLATFATALLLLAAAWRGAAAWATLLVPAAAFALLAARHERLLRAGVRAGRAVQFYERALARIEDRWAGGGSTGERFRNDRHLYANDLDLFGPASLFELLSIARTADGEQMLASWLLAPASPGAIAARQAAVQELAGDLDFRERLAVAGEAPAAVDTGTLIGWAEAPPSPLLPRLHGLSLVGAAAVAGAIIYLITTGDLRPLLTVLVLEILVFRGLRERMERMLHVAGQRVRALDGLAELVGQIERRRMAAPRLASLRDELGHGGVAASTAIARLHRLAEFHDWQHSWPLVPIAVFFAGYLGTAVALGSVMLLWSPLLTIASERWRKRHGRHVRGWVAAVAEVEALASIAAYHHEHPADPFPDIVQEGGNGRALAAFEGTGLAHPLLPSRVSVPNDVCLSGDTRLLVVSGSNMSGKSTLLRTVGVNAVLALAGAPVRARSLRLSPVAVGATLRIQDSLQEGRSRFYAEITRIRALADAAAGPVPLLFLLDEIFHGTNSHDRLVGAQGVLRSLLDRGAIGLVTTHDLALTAMSDVLGPRAVNVHFEDRFEDGEMRFDYRLRPGPVARSNALALMRAVGLDVAAETE